MLYQLDVLSKKLDNSQSVEKTKRGDTLKVPLRVMTLNFELLTEIDQYESLQITRSWHGIGELELHINRYMRDVDKLQRGNIIFPHNKLNKGYIIRHKEIELNEDGKASENWIIRALPLKSWIAQRITYPPSHTAYDNKQDNAESVILHYVKNNVINPTDSKRKIENLVLADNENRGDTISWQSRYKNLAEEIAEISLLSGLGWNIDIDLDNQQFVFRVLEGRDLSVNQSTLPPAIFSPEFGTLKELSYVESDLNYMNYAIVAGQGEGVDRRVIEVGNSEGYERYELFVDARDIEETDENDDPIPEPIIEQNLIERGLQKLKEHEQEIYLEGQVLRKSRLEYEQDYNLGDIVTLQNKDWNVTLDARITEIKEIYEPSGFDLEVTFNNSRPTLISKIKQEISNISPEITR